MEEDSAEGMERVCEERRTENWRSQSRSTISWAETAARRTWDEVRARRETRFLEEEGMKDRPARRRGESARGSCEDRMNELSVPSSAIDN